MNEMTELIAMIAGPYLFITGCGFLISQHFYMKMIEEADKSDPILINLSGATHFIVGLLVLVKHFTWSSATEIIVTLIGCAATLKGVLLIVAPALALKTDKPSLYKLYLSSTVFIGLGVILTYQAYGPLFGLTL